MRDAVIIFISIILAMAIGSYLFFSDAPRFSTPGLPGVGAPDHNFTVIHEGSRATGIDRRVNYRIMNEQELMELWELIYGPGGPARPVVDFSTYEVIAVFDGSHSTGGYKVSVTDVADADGVRTVHILREQPGGGCLTSQGITSPFQLVRVTKTTLPIQREEQFETNECS